MLKTKNLTIQIKIAVPKCTACAAKRVGAIIERLMFSNLVAQCSTKKIFDCFSDLPIGKIYTISSQSRNLKSTNCGIKTANFLA